MKAIKKASKVGQIIKRRKVGEAKGTKDNQLQKNPNRLKEYQPKMKKYKTTIIKFQKFTRKTI